MSVVVPRNSLLRNRVVALAWLLAVIVLAQGVWAGSGDVFVRTGRSSGLKITVATTWPEVNGSRPCRIVIEPLGRTKFARDRDLTVRTFPYQWRGNQAYKNIEIERGVLCPEGAESVTATVMLQQTDWIGGLDFQVFESGRKLKDVSAPFDFPATNNNRHGFREGLPSILLLDSRADGRALTRTVPSWLTVLEKSMKDLASIQYNVKNNVKNELESMQRFCVLAPGDLPTNWVGLGGLDLVIVHLDELQRMSQEAPRQWAALESWVVSGGNLVVFDVGLGCHRAGELETLLGLSDGDEESNEWKLPPLQNKQESVAFFKPNGSRRDPEPQPVRRGPAAPRTTACFMVRPMGAGLLIATTGQEAPFYGKSEWQWFFNTVSADRWLNYRRLGAGVDTPNSDFWAFRIKGVGRAPINVFRILITLFVLVIGPLNYFLLRRLRRTGWMLMTVPLGAALATASLLGYALVTDGLGVRARVHSLTHYDQRTGHVTAWSRQVYYASIVPSGGMSFPDDAMVMPLKYPAYRDPRIRRSRMWDEKQQVLQTGYLTSRTLSQFYVVRSRKSSGGMEITAEAAGPPKVVNRLGVALQYVYVHDSAGNLYAAENVGVDEQLALKPADDAVARDRLSQDARLAVDLDGGTPTFGTRVDNYLPGPSQETSLLEQRLSEVRNGPSALGPKSFIAVADGSEEVPLGMKQTRKEDSLYIITGQW